MERESFVFYRSFYEASKFLSNEDKWKLFDMVCQYGLYWNEIETDWPAMWMFLLIKPQLDANNRRYENWCKWWAPEGNSNAVKNWKNISKQPKNNQNTTKNQPNDNQKQPNVNDNVNVNVNENDNVSSMLDADASRWIVAKKNVYDEEVEALRLRLGAELNVEVIDKVVEFDKVKKWKKIRKYAEAQIKAFITTLNTRPTDKEKIDMLNTCIWNDYQWIYRNNRAQPVKPERPSWNLFH